MKDSKVIVAINKMGYPGRPAGGPTAIAA
jgi:hypothetical protein